MITKEGRVVIDGKSTEHGPISRRTKVVLIVDRLGNDMVASEGAVLMDNMSMYSRSGSSIEVSNGTPSRSGVTI